MAYNCINEVDARCYQLCVHQIPEKHFSERNRIWVWDVIIRLGREWVHVDDLDILDALLPENYIKIKSDHAVRCGFKYKT